MRMPECISVSNETKQDKLFLQSGYFFGVGLIPVIEKFPVSIHVRGKLDVLSGGQWLEKYLNRISVFLRCRQAGSSILAHNALELSRLYFGYRIPYVSYFPIESIAVQLQSSLIGLYQQPGSLRLVRGRYLRLQSSKGSGGIKQSESGNQGRYPVGQTPNRHAVPDDLLRVCFGILCGGVGLRGAYISGSRQAQGRRHGLIYIGALFLTLLSCVLLIALPWCGNGGVCLFESLR